jgi:sugar/nucleoside kinase (ribokinase family)
MAAPALTFEQTWQRHLETYRVNILARQKLDPAETDRAIREYQEECVQFFHTLLPSIPLEQWQTKMREELQQVHIIAVSSKDLEFLLKQKTRYQKDLLSKQAKRGVITPKVDPIIIWDLTGNKQLFEHTDLRLNPN